MNNSVIIVNVVRFLSLVFLQVLLLNHINFLGYINPYLYVIFILVYPLDGNKTLLIFLSFLLGLSIDLFGDTGGIHAASCVAIAYIRPVILKFSFGVSYQYNMVKINKAPLAERIMYITLIVLIHHLILFSLEIFSLAHILLLLKSTLFSSIFSILLIFCTLLLFGRKN
ncbi:rod shape-determining protein MreD [Ulvibacter antarcticus]|uniref:Rod shape-determining protein MreD n=1 Tax=Ulvibacter antarcticus TaxID=442714 RepID=A0A3L9Z4W5_9FLAO|nr:rod shape-determining protein MreD [Ulvibacter antarcticus]